MKKHIQSYKDQIDSSMEAYFRDQKLRQANKTQSKVQSISNYTANTLIKESRKELRTSKFKHRTEYYKNTKENVDKMKHFEQKKENQSNLPEKTQCFKQEKGN